MLLPLVFAASLSIPVPGGLAALSHALGIDAPDRGRALAEIVRVVYATGRQRELLAHLASARGGAADDTIPLPLSADVWSRAVFGRQVTAAELFAAVLSDRSAALLAYGLTALDDETLDFLSRHPALVSALCKKNAAVFAAFSSHIRIHGNRVVPPGGDGAVRLWESVTGAQVTRAGAFLEALMTASGGKLAYLYDVIGHVDAETAAMALGSGQFPQFARTVTGLFSEWDVRKHPFSRPSNDLLAMLLRIRHQPLDLVALTKELLSDGMGRADRLEQFAFGERVFDVRQHRSADAVAAVRLYPRFSMLMLTLERAGVRDPSLYAALARRAERVPVDSPRDRTEIVHLQGAIALVDRMRRVRTIDRETAETLLRALATSDTARWLDRDLRLALSVPSSQPLEPALLGALAGARRQPAPRLIAWEGEDYVLDVAASELTRIRQFRRTQGGPPVDAALALHRLAPPLTGDAAARISRLADTLLADALLSLAYAADWPEAAGSNRIRNAARRHDFGFDAPTHDGRERLAWSLPQRSVSTTTGWRLEGALLGLDLGLAALALRRVSVEAFPTPPAVSSTERAAFVESFGLLNPLAFDDDTQAAIARAVAEGERRVAALRADGAELDSVIRAIRMDGRRARAVRWALVHDAGRVRSYFSTRELLVLGGGGELDLRAWGMSARQVTGCLCPTASPAVRSDALVGRPHLGLLASGVADLHLQVAMALHDLQLPAALTKSVLAAAAQEFLDRVNPSDPDDWLALVRTARAMSRERVEDYLAGTASSGPLALARRELRQVEGTRR